MRRQYRATVYNRETQCLGLIPFGKLDPYRVQPKGGILYRYPGQLPLQLPGVNRQFFARIHLALAYGYIVKSYSVLVRSEAQVVSYMNSMNQEAQFLGELLAHALDTAE